jgi:hypothetical protein
MSIVTTRACADVHDVVVPKFSLNFGLWHARLAVRRRRIADAMTPASMIERPGVGSRPYCAPGMFDSTW